MTGQDLYLLGKNSAAAEACIPYNLTHTLPHLYLQERLVAEFWYYTANYNEEAVYIPQFYLALELPGGNPVKMLRLTKTTECLGAAPELITQNYYKQQNDYLESCTAFLQKGIPNAEDLNLLHEKWLCCQPQALRPKLEALASCSESPIDVPSVVNRQAPTDMISYWKMQLADAIRSADPNAVEKAQAELNRAYELSRSK